MAADPKNIFNFGTGDIDKDQWLKDIDNGQEEFITTYGSATNKHRTALLRLAFLDLRSRLASGDMLRRNSDGMYEFSSALNRDDKHMQEAYERALGFMGNLARKQINTPKPEPEKKKVTGSTLEDEFKKSLGPDGRYNETAYWARTPEARGLGLQQFLTGFKNRLNDYQDFSSFTDRAGLEAKIDAAIQALNNKKYNDWSISELGFTKDWINKPKDEDEEPEKTETDQLEEELKDRLQQQHNLQIRLALNWDDNKGNPESWSFTTTPYDYKGMFNHYRGTLPSLPTNLFVTPLKQQESLAKLRLEFDTKNIGLIDSYFSNLAVNYKSLLLKDFTRLASLLGLIQASVQMGDKTDNPYKTLFVKYFTPMLNGAYLINGSGNKHTGRYAFYTPTQIGLYAPGIHEVSIQDLEDPTVKAILLGVAAHKEGGKIKYFEPGGLFDDLDWYNYLNNQLPTTSSEKPNTRIEASEPVEKMDTSDIVNIAGPLALDITSMFSANAPGIGTLISAGTGIGSTIWSGIYDWDSKDVWGSLSNIGTGLVADGVGLIPGLGISGKVGKVASRLAKYSKYLGLALSYYGAKDAAAVLYKGSKNGFNLTPEEWKTLSYGLAGVVQGGAGVKRANRVDMRRGAANKAAHVTYDIKGNRKVKVTDIDAEKPIGTEKTKYAYDKEGLILSRGQSKGNRFTSAPSKRYQELLRRPKDNTILYPWETAEGFSWGNITGKSKIDKTWEESKEWLKNRRKNKNSNNTEVNKGTEPTNATETEKKKLGGILKALRNGGILKGQEGLHTGVKLSNKARGWHDDIFSNYEGAILDTLLNLEGQDREAAVKWLNDMQDLHSALYRDRGDFTKNTQYDLRVEAYQKAYKDANGFIKLPMGFNIGIQPNYNTRYDFSGIPRISGDNPTEFNDDGLYSQITDDRRVLGRLNDWSPERLNAFNEKLKALGYTMDNNYNDKYYRIKPLNNPQTSTNPNDDILKQMQGESPVTTNTGGGVKTVVDKLVERPTIIQTDFKNPFDPSHLITAGKLFQAIRGNANIYGNLLKEMPQAPLRDPIHRQLAIVGNQRVIDEARNKIGDLRQINRQLFGSDQQTNFATSLETERTGRDIYDKSLDLDAARQFDTALKLWNLKNEDTFYNTKVGDDNRKSLVDRARMMAQIRAAWRSGDQNAIMGALADEGNWFMKKYQREQDIINLAREQQLGSREQFLENYIRDKHKDYDALKAKLADPKVSDAEKALIRNTIQQWNLEILREAPAAWSLKIYNAFHTPGFGGGYKTSLIGKDGVKLEVEKLKARGKDNDRYVSMIKDLRKTSYRRRRR